ncbi:type II toxin-antitoxin system HipA family toxin [Paraburkholderia sediminicola]|uniref:type II toxin-antitoxin system HipA family toxin n=1 Tax=Paraburkholderia sediminicola TaxID=458836 RepID=UPI0038B7E173
MKKLSVVYAGWSERFELGKLGDDGTNLIFEYSSEAQQRGLELSPLHLALRQQAYDSFPDHQFRLPGLISDALPDGWGMLLMDRLFRQRGWEPARMSPLDRLAFIGEKAMGALVFEPAQGDDLQPSDVQLVELAREVREVMTDGSTELLRELVLMGGSPHGARPKVLVNFDPHSGRMSNSEQSAGSPWLVKFPAQYDHKEVCAVEALYAVLAQACEIPVPATRYFDLGSRLSAFGIERFDRSGAQRVPMHTAAGALNANFRYPSIDYGSLLKLTRFITRDEREVLRAFERCVFNVVFNNRDDHTKNFSFRLSAQGQWQFSPAYDLTFNEGPGGEHQMDVCGESRAPARRHLLQLASLTGIPARAAEAVIERTVGVAGRFRDHARSFPIRRATVSLIAGKIETNRTRML